MANDQRTQNPCIVKGSEPSAQEKKTEQQAEKQSSKQGEKKQAACAASPTETKTENQSSNPGNNSFNTYGPDHCASENRRAVSLANELHDIEYGLCALRRLQDILESDDADDPENLVREISAILTLIIYRITLARHMVEGKIDPGFIWSIWNDAGPDYWNMMNGTDVIFEKWTLNQKLIHARAVLDDAERRVAEELARQRERNK